MTSGRDETATYRVTIPRTNWGFEFTLWPSKCVVCDGGHIHITFEGLGTLCLRHAIDWALDDYESEIDWAEYDRAKQLGRENR